MSNGRIYKAVFSLWTMQLVSYLLPLITLPYLVRTLTIHGYGRVAFAVSTVHFVVLLVDSGFNAISQRNIAKSGFDTASIRRELLASIAARGLIALSAGLLISCAIAFNSGWIGEAPLFAAAALSVLGTLAFPQWLFIALDRSGMMAILHLVGRIIAVLLILLLIQGPDDVLLATALQASGTLLAGAAAMVWLFRQKYLRVELPERTAVFQLLQSGSRVGVPLFLVAAANNSAVFFLGLYSNPAVVGVFAAAEKIIRAASGLFQAVIQAAYPIICRKHPDSVLVDAARQFTGAAVAVAALAAITIAVCANEIVSIAFGQQDPQFGDLLVILAPAIVGTCLSLCGSHFVLLARNQDVAFSNTQLIVALLGFLAFWAAASTSDPAALGLAFTAVELVAAAIVWITILSIGQKRVAA